MLAGRRPPHLGQLVDGDRAPYRSDMAQAQCVRIPLLPEHGEAFVAWLGSLSSRRAELSALLAEEGMLAELVFVERSADGLALVLYTRAADLQAAHARYLASSHPIDVEMRAWQARALDLSRASLLTVALEHGVPDA